MNGAACGKSWPAGIATAKAPWWLPVGLALLVTAWGVSWFGPAPARWHTFFPLWLGCILTLDGLTRARSGSSLLSRSPWCFVLLFLYSLPLWWLFEAANRALGNWRYLSGESYDPVRYVLLASLAFSTVIPAIFLMAGLLRTTRSFGRLIFGPVIAPGRVGMAAIVALGLLMVALALALPRIAFPLIWIGFFLLLDPVNDRLGFPSISAEVRVGRWDTVLTLFAAGLCCGLLWELWNWRAMPKWEYDVPFVGWPKVFEMPLLGYGGYLPFALEVYAVFNLLNGLAGRRGCATCGVIPEPES